MWRIWMLYDAKRILVANAVFLFSLAVLIHFILLSTERFNWIEGPSASVTVEQMQGSEPFARMVPDQLIG
ncbi:MAG: light-harvesting antenna LH1, alpha subunit [Pseudomonadota bacterium]